MIASMQFPSIVFDEAKATANIRKHGVSFEEAGTTFFDLDAITEPDEEHSQPGDERFINLGMSLNLRLLFVVHNEEDGVIRIIHARLATPSQRDRYEKS